MISVIKAWISTREQKDAHLKLMAEHLLKCASVINELRHENAALRERGDALAFVFEHNDWSIEAQEQVAMQIASWREMQGILHD